MNYHLNKIKEARAIILPMKSKKEALAFKVGFDAACSELLTVVLALRIIEKECKDKRLSAVAYLALSSIGDK